VADAVAWDVAERVAARVAGREPLACLYLYASLAPDFEELTAEAEELVVAATGLRSTAGPARARVTDRAGWVAANVRSFQRLLQPLTERLAPKVSASPLAPVARAAAGAEVGALLGWMSTRVLGQYDVLVAEEDRPEEQDIVYFVGPNILALEKQFGFPPREFRLWLAIHEVAHRAQFTGVPWMRGHFVSLVHESLAMVDPDPKRLAAALARVVDDLRSGRKPLDEGGVAALLATPEQREVLGRVGGLMSLLEGHGDVTMDRAGADRIPGADRFGRVLHQRRTSPNLLTKLVQRLIGLEAKLQQYEQGERFIRTVEARWGEGGIDRIWAGPEWLPSLAEIRDPEAWLRRVEGPDVVGGRALPG
jgi:coenzyme F420 biosynthesis associated uncharacterized protein